MTYCETAALAAGHSTEAIDNMTLSHLERIAIYNMTHGGLL